MNFIARSAVDHMQISVDENRMIKSIADETFQVFLGVSVSS